MPENEENVHRRDVVLGLLSRTADSNVMCSRTVGRTSRWTQTVSVFKDKETVESRCLLSTLCGQEALTDQQWKVYV